LSGGLLSADVPVSAEPAGPRLRPHHHLRAGLPARGRGVLGGTKYLFPGIAGPDIINFTHWLGAVITSSAVIGAGYTPVRAVIDRAAAMLDRPMSCVSLVVTHDGVADSTWARRASRGTPRRRCRRARTSSGSTAVPPVLSIMPTMYDDLWTAAKGMYKLEPAMADGGEIVIFARRTSPR